MRAQTAITDSFEEEECEPRKTDERLRIKNEELTTWELRTSSSFSFFRQLTLGLLQLHLVAGIDFVEQISARDELPFTEHHLHQLPSTRGRTVTVLKAAIDHAQSSAAGRLRLALFAVGAHREIVGPLARTLRSDLIGDC